MRQKNTFIVRIDNQQNNTWQGRIVWADENRTEHFRSMLEMLKLMEEAMASGQQAMNDKENCVWALQVSLTDNIRIVDKRFLVAV